MASRCAASSPGWTVSRRRAISPKSTSPKSWKKFRRAAPELREISFDTIAGAGPNGAIVHYRPSRSTNRRVEPGSLLLIDSGGQYRDGTTDITRTVGDRRSHR